ncbi:UDP-N-acetylmuramoyl-L-alanyl-D-glutamate--2,6-diaminopimelate ligase [Trueperella pyogenes]|uniref:UDP-N-acetylmuramoyl-L-alanyl-D-glutamate--2, 6-diaminopimelate ligase n=1 Tax=Trueperella pyogenes TaxID=1661 RepID=UPI00345D0294
MTYRSRTSLADIAQLIGTTPVDGTVLGVCADNRLVQPGDLFIAARGATVHAAKFARLAVAAGAAAVLTDVEGAKIAGDLGVPVLVAADPARVAGLVASYCWGIPDQQLTTFAVTGTNGKTSTAYMLDDVLTRLGRNTGLIGTVEVRIAGEAVPAALTTPQPVDLQRILAQLVERGGTDLVMEASSHALAQGRTSPIRFDVAGFTNLTQDHLDYHETLEEYFKAKALLFDEQHSARGVIVVDDEWGQRLYREVSAARPGCVVSLSLAGNDADWFVTSHVSGSAQHLHLAGPLGTIDTLTTLPGAFNVANAALAAVMVLESGVSVRELEQVLGRRGISPQIPGRMEVVGERPYTVVDFAHNTDALVKAMVSLRQLRAGKLIVLTGAAGDRDRGKRPMMAAAVAEHADYLIVTDDDPHSEDPAQIRSEMIAGIPEGFDFVEIGDRETAIREAITTAACEDTILIAGRGHETIQDVAGTARHIDDRVVARNALAQRMEEE